MPQLNDLLPELNDTFDDLRHLLRLVACSDERALSQLIAMYWKKVYKQALVYLQTASEAEELTQDVFLKIWKNRELLPDLNNFSDYLFIITRNEIISHLRKRRFNTSETLLRDLIDTYFQPDQQLQFKQVNSLVLKAINSLPPVRKKVLKMSRIDGLSYQEIAQELEIGRNGVKDHIVKALVHIKTYLRVHGDDYFAQSILLFVAINNF